MSHRTQDLPPLSGLRRIIREFRYHEGSRQVLAFVLIAWFAYVSEPIRLALIMGSPWYSQETCCVFTQAGSSPRTSNLPRTAPTHS
ncbi:MAG: hypothetical protein CM1200mP36_05680 [Gammaproteobacteria bacterium]|nr:MAG: hypothetical protein CM1200mP36_05680 [Gammaproteobacteria bacterium]